MRYPLPNRRSENSSSSSGGDDDHDHDDNGDKASDCGDVTDKYLRVTALSLPSIYSHSAQVRGPNSTHLFGLLSSELLLQIQSMFLPSVIVLYPC